MEQSPEGRWFVCSGRSELLAAASALALAGCVDGFAWDSCSRHIRDAIAFSDPETTCNVIVGAGVADGDPFVAACDFAALRRGKTVLCIKGAAAVCTEAAARGVTAAVEPAGLVRLLSSLRTEELRRASQSSSAPHAPLPMSSAPGAFAAGPSAGPSHPSPTVQVSTPVGWDAAVAAEGLATGASGQAESDRASGEDSDPSPDARHVRSSGAVPLEEGAPAESKVFDLDSIKEKVVMRPVVELSQDVECRVAGMDRPVPTICLASARGGVGKSAIAALCAVALARAGISVSLVDLDFQFGTCLGYLGSDETDGLVDAGCAPKSVRVDARTLARCRTTPQRCLAAYEFCRLPEQAELLSGLSGELLRAARAGSEVAVVDLPTGLNETVAQALELADRCLFVADQGALSLESAAAHQALCARLGIPRTKLVTVMNRCDPRHRDEGFLSRVGFETQTPQVVRVLDGGLEVTQMLSIGRCAELLSIQNKFATSVCSMLSGICSDLGISGFEAPRPEDQRAQQDKAPHVPWRKARVREDEVTAPCPF